MSSNRHFTYSFTFLDVFCDDQTTIKGEIESEFFDSYDRHTCDFIVRASGTDFIFNKNYFIIDIFPNYNDNDNKLDIKLYVVNDDLCQYVFESGLACDYLFDIYIHNDVEFDEKLKPLLGKLMNIFQRMDKNRVVGI